MKVTTIKTDVLVIGGGVAGLRSAVEATRNDAKVTILIKGGGTCSAGIVGFNAAFRKSSSGDSPARYFNDTILGGEFLNDHKLVATMVYNSEEEVYTLKEMGVLFDKKNEELAVRQAAGSTCPRTLHYQDNIGPKMMAVFVNYLENEGVEILRNTAAFELIKKDNRVIGALAVNRSTEELLICLAKSTVIACGGSGNIYSFTTNPEGVTGDGYIMARRAGVKLRDMEFVQFEPFIMVYPEQLKTWSVPTTLVWDGAKVYNSNGDEFLPKEKDGKVLPLTKDNLSRLIYKEIQEGRGTINGGVYFDMTGLSEEILDNYPRYLKHCQTRGVDPKKTPVEVAPAQHHMMGGIIINPSCETSLEGLLAAGEVVGGVHGANRLAGSAGIDMLVFGAISGFQAAKEAQNTLEIELEDKELENYIQNISGLLGSDNNLDKAIKLQKELKDIMISNVGIVREATKMTQAKEKLNELKADLEAVEVNDLLDFIKLFEIRNAFELAEIIVDNALMREESRGDHNRSDFPARDDLNWLKSIIV